jgi:hypothetical protein
VHEQLGAVAPADPDESPRPFVVELGEWLVPPDAGANWAQWSLFTDVIPVVRDRIEDRWGLRPPGVFVRSAFNLGRTEMRIMLHDVPGAGRLFDVPNVAGPVPPLVPPEEASADQPESAAPDDARAVVDAIGAHIESHLDVVLPQLVTVDGVAELIDSWYGATGDGSSSPLGDPAVVLRATALVRALLDERIPVRREHVGPLVELADVDLQREAVEAVRAASIDMLRERWAGRPRVDVPSWWEDDGDPAADGSTRDPARTECLITELGALLDDTSDAVVVVSDAARRAALSALLRPRFPGIDVATAAEVAGLDLDRRGDVA